MKTIRIILLVLIIIGLGLLVTQKMWVPGLVNQILVWQGNTPATTTPPPAAVDTTAWKTFSNQTLSFKYPENIPTTYIHTVDWPPKVAVTDNVFSCTPGGQETMQAGVTAPETINGRDYCVTKESEGAAGSTYTNYAYAREIQNKFVIFTFSLRFVQCGNYPEPQMTACNQERAPFDIGPTVDQMFQTLKVL